MWFGFKQPFLWGERCVTAQKTAAKETTNEMEMLKISAKIGERYCLHISRAARGTSKARAIYY